MLVSRLMSLSMNQSEIYCITTHTLGQFGNHSNWIGNNCVVFKPFQDFSEHIPIR